MHQPSLFMSTFVKKNDNAREILQLLSVFRKFVIRLTYLCAFSRTRFTNVVILFRNCCHNPSFVTKHDIIPILIFGLIARNCVILTRMNETQCVEEELIVLMRPVT